MHGNEITNNYEGTGRSDVEFPPDGGNIEYDRSKTFELRADIKDDEDCKKCKSFVIDVHLYENGKSIEREHLTVGGGSKTISVTIGDQTYGSYLGMQLPLTGKPRGTKYSLFVKISETHYLKGHNVKETTCFTTNFTL